MLKFNEAQSLIYGGEKCYSSYKSVASCEGACPVGMRVPDYVAAISRGKLDEAYWIMRESTPFVALCGYVCHHPCEKACLRGKIDAPVSIRSLKRYAAEHVMSLGVDKPQRFGKQHAEKIAIIGSGPAGLSAAYFLAEKGYGVTIFEAQSQPGGMLYMGIPEFILPRKVIDAQVNYIKALGVEFKFGVNIGRDLTLDDLFSQGYKTIFLGIGAQNAVNLKIPGIEAKGVYTALSLIRDVNLGKTIPVGDNVVVIGGGNVAVNAARIAIRLGAKEVNLVCLEDRENMPAFKREIQEAEEEGIKFNNSLAPLEITMDSGKVFGIHFGAVEKLRVDDLGKMQIRVSKEKQSKVFSASTILVAIGQKPAADSYEGLEINARGLVEVDPETLATRLPGVFAGGDAVKLPGTVSEALGAGKRAAISIDQYLRKLPFTHASALEVIDVPDDRLPKFVEVRERAKTPMPAINERISSFEAVELTLSEEAAMHEANRCMNCSMCGHCLFEYFRCCYQTGSRLL